MEIYTEEELDLLRMYTDRPTKGPIKYRSKVNELLGINEFSNTIVNTFLGTNGRGPKTLYRDMSSGSDLREFLNQIETLFGIMCKYGMTHDLPSLLYRAECQYEEILGAYNSGEWTTTSFKSCSRNRAEAQAFESDENGGSCMLHISSPLEKIPFISVNDLLEESHVYDDEKEILLPPFLHMEINGEALYSKEYFMQATKMLIPDQESGKETSRFNYDEHNISDEELKQIIELQKKPDLTQEELSHLEKLLNKMQTYLRTRFETIRVLYMERPIIIEGKISEENFRLLHAFGCNIPGVNNKGTVFTLDDVLKSAFSTEQKQSSLELLTIVPEDELKITRSLVLALLDVARERRERPTSTTFSTERVAAVQNLNQDPFCQLDKYLDLDH